MTPYDAYIGQKFGSLQLLDVLVDGKKKNGSPRYIFKCKCDICGSLKDKKEYILKRKNACGCGRGRSGSFRENSLSWKGCGEISGKFYSEVKAQAKYRKIQFDLSIQDLWNQFVKQSGRCVYTGLALTFLKRDSDLRVNQTASLDRIDSNLGYSSDNIQWVHKQINNMKNIYSHDEFVSMCRLVSNHIKG